MATQRIPAVSFSQQIPKPVRSYAKDNPLLAEKFSQWLLQNYSPHTGRAYGTLIADFCRFIGSRSLTEIKHIDIRAYFASLQGRGMGSQSLDQKLYGLRAFFKFLTLGRVVSTNVARFVQTRRRHRNLPTCPTVEEVRMLIEAAESLRDRAMIEMYYATGARLAEVVGMRSEDVDFSDVELGTAHVLGKGNKERVVYFGRMAREALLAYLGDRREGFVFREDRPVETLGVRMAKPNKDETGVWWRGWWSEYPDDTGPLVTKWKWLR